MKKKRKWKEYVLVLQKNKTEEDKELHKNIQRLKTETDMNNDKIF